MRNIDETVQVRETLISSQYFIGVWVVLTNSKLLYLLKDIHDYINHDLGGFPARISNSSVQHSQAQRRCWQDIHRTCDTGDTIPQHHWLC